MADLIDVLTTAGNAQTVTVNTGGVLEVAVSAPGAFPSGLFKNGGGDSKLQNIDNFRVLSAGLLLPYQLGLSSVVPVVRLLTRDSLGFQAAFNVGSSSGDLYLPLENFELALDIFQPLQAAPGVTYTQLVAAINPALKISMVGVPVALNAQVLPVVVFIKIEHNLPLLP